MPSKQVISVKNILVLLSITFISLFMIASLFYLYNSINPKLHINDDDVCQVRANSQIMRACICFGNITEIQEVKGQHKIDEGYSFSLSMVKNYICDGYGLSYQP